MIIIAAKSGRRAAALDTYKIVKDDLSRYKKEILTLHNQWRKEQEAQNEDFLTKSLQFAKQLQQDRLTIKSLRQQVLQHEELKLVQEEENNKQRQIIHKLRMEKQDIEFLCNQLRATNDVLTEDNSKVKELRAKNEEYRLQNLNYIKEKDIYDRARLDLEDLKERYADLDDRFVSLTSSHQTLQLVAAGTNHKLSSMLQAKINLEIHLGHNKNELRDLQTLQQDRDEQCKELEERVAQLEMEI